MGQARQTEWGKLRRGTGKEDKVRQTRRMEGEGKEAGEVRKRPGYVGRGRVALELEFMETKL